MSKDCSRFVVQEDYDNNLARCTCPKCAGFLPKDFPIGAQFQCKKCGAVLETLPVSNPDLEDDEQDDNMEFGGMICPVPKYAVKIQVQEVKTIRRKRKHSTIHWAMGDGFSRRVWQDKRSLFIEVSGERIELRDPRIKLITPEVKFG